MTMGEFESGMAALEGVLIVSSEQKANREARWCEIYRRIASFTSAEFEAARDIIEDENDYLPAVREIIGACQQAREAVTLKPVEGHKFKPVKHECSKEKPQPSEALRDLILLSPYEAEHILCPGKIPATCPRCGAQHLDTTVLSELAKRHGIDGWNLYWKGLMLCEKCEE
jgi:hypothetical protein